MRWHLRSRFRALAPFLAALTALFLTANQALAATAGTSGSGSRPSNRRARRTGQRLGRSRLTMRGKDDRTALTGVRTGDNGRSS